jgi:hypothetical protein
MGPQWDVFTAEVPGFGRVAYVMPNIDGDYPEELKQALLTRREATITSVCRCGARMLLPSREVRREAKRRGEILRPKMEHEYDCPASDEGLLEIAVRHGHRFGRWA